MLKYCISEAGEENLYYINNFTLNKISKMTSSSDHNKNFGINMTHKYFCLIQVFFE